MARKDLLKSLMSAQSTPSDRVENRPDAGAENGAADDAVPASGPASDPTPAPPPASGRYGGGAIGAVGQSIAELRARALIEVPADMIDEAGLRDRLDADPQGHAALVASIREHGQQVPVLLRHDPNTEGRYQIVYGRRRVAALRELRQPVRALLRHLDDRALILAQGQENSARKDLSFIEKAHFAETMRRMGFDRVAICAALHVDKTVVSRMLGIAEAVGPELIRAIGAAPSVGRDRWLTLAERLRQGGAEARERAAARLDTLADDTSDARFEALVSELAPARRPAASGGTGSLPLETSGTGPLGRLSRARGRTTLSFDPEAAAFADWIARNIARLHDAWRAEKDEADRD